MKKIVKETSVKSKKLSREKKTNTEIIEANTSEITSESKTTTSSRKTFEKDDLLKFKLLETKYQNAKMSIQLKTYEFEKEKAKWEDHGRKLLLEIEKGKTYFQTVEKDLFNLREELEKKYSINMNKISYHEITGEIYEH